MLSVRRRDPGKSGKVVIVHPCGATIISGMNKFIRLAQKFVRPQKSCYGRRNAIACTNARVLYESVFNKSVSSSVSSSDVKSEPLRARVCNFVTQLTSGLTLTACINARCHLLLKLLGKVLLGTIKRKRPIISVVLSPLLPNQSHSVRASAVSALNRSQN